MAKTFEYIYEEFPAPTSDTDSIHRWFESVHPTEYQLDLIPKDVTFADCSKAICFDDDNNWPIWYRKLDTYPRELIYCACKSLM